jgi:hypothetical protein
VLFTIPLKLTINGCPFCQNGCPIKLDKFFAKKVGLLLRH